MELNAIVSWLRLRFRLVLGKLYNIAGIPGIVRDCNYQATVCDTRIQVRAKELFTIVTVNGLEIYFHRLTGVIDGVGFATDQQYCNSDEAPRSELLRGPSGLPPRTVQR